MKTYKVTYLNSNTGVITTIKAKGLSIERVRAAEENSMRMFNKIKPELKLVSVVSA